MNVLGVDIGGTKIRLSVINEEGTIVADKRVPTTFPLYELLEKEVLTMIEQHSSIKAIGVGTAGFVDTEQGKILFMGETLPGWTGTEVKKQLQQATGLPVSVNNDANCASLAEAKIGAGQDYDRMVCMTLGTGLGGGIVMDGEIMSGPNGGAGEIGHMILYPGGKTCNCGRKGCYEQYISGTALANRIREAGLTIAPEELFTNKDNPVAKKIIQSFLFDLANAIASLQACLDMEVVILGGGVSDSAEYWLDDLHAQLKPLLLHPIDIRLAQFGNEAGVLGAAMLVLPAEEVNRR